MHPDVGHAWTVIRGGCAERLAPMAPSGGAEIGGRRRSSVERVVRVGATEG